MSAPHDAAALYAHLATGTTHVARCWEVRRSDGLRLGFTDHDCDLSFDGLTFAAQSGLTARAIEQGTGLSVDNTEAMGALSDAAISEVDIEAGRFDAAEVIAWLVDWQDVAARQILFRGHIGEIRRAGGAFQAELRGLTDLLSRPVGRVFQKPCTAVLGDATCRVDLSDPALQWQGALTEAREGRVLVLPVPMGFAPGWFARGRAEMLTGAGAGLTRWIKRDLPEGEARRIDLWEPFRAPLAVGDEVRIVAGCDKRFETCARKFENLVNFQGFPDIPGDDWLVLHPSGASQTQGGSRR